MGCLLLVEDSEDDEALSLRAIRNCGVPCDVTVIRHGGDAIALLPLPPGPPPDLIVLDFHLPGRNGLEILRALRSHETTRYLPIVMLSGLETNKDIATCLAEGANSCVQKPFDPETYQEHVALIVKYWLTVNKRPDGSPFATP
jgi:two-component system response regulator